MARADRGEVELCLRPYLCHQKRLERSASRAGDAARRAADLVQSAALDVHDQVGRQKRTLSRKVAELGG
jgi:hypothetical protein